jgi:hypothetical protein
MGMSEAARTEIARNLKILGVKWIFLFTVVFSVYCGFFCLLWFTLATLMGRNGVWEKTMVPRNNSLH